MHVGEEALHLEQVPPGAAQKLLVTPNVGCNIRVDLTTGVPVYKELPWTSWQLHLALRTCGGDARTCRLYRDTVNRKWPRSIWASHD